MKRMIRARMIKKELREHFPGNHFSVSTLSYADGNDTIFVHWDGIETPSLRAPGREVERVLRGLSFIGPGKYHTGTLGEVMIQLGR